MKLSGLKRLKTSSRSFDFMYGNGTETRLFTVRWARQLFSSGWWATVDGVKKKTAHIVDVITTLFQLFAFDSSESFCSLHRSHWLWCPENSSLLFNPSPWKTPPSTAQSASLTSPYSLTSKDHGHCIHSILFFIRLLFLHISCSLLSNSLISRTSLFVVSVRSIITKIVIITTTTIGITITTITTLTIVMERVRSSVCLRRLLLGLQKLWGGWTWLTCWGSTCSSVAAPRPCLLQLLLVLMWCPSQ